MVRPAGVAAAARAAAAEREAASRRASSVPNSSRTRCATFSRSSIGVDVPPVTPTMRALAERHVGRQVLGAFDLDRVGAGDLAEARQLLGIRRRPAADDDHDVDFPRGFERVLLPADRDRADGVDDLELVASRHHVGGELLELPGRLRDWEMSAIFLRRGIRSQSSSSSTTIAFGANPRRPTTSGCFGVPSSTIV